MHFCHAILRRMKRLGGTAAALFALAFFSGCASLTSISSNRLDQQIAQVDAAYQTLDANRVSTYNKAVESIARRIDGAKPVELRSQLASVGVKLDQQNNIRLPLVAYHRAPASRIRNESSDLGVPMLLDYDTSHASLYPRDGLVLPATAIYRRIDGKPHLSLLSGKNSVELNGSNYPLKIDNVAPITAMAHRGEHVARSGFRNMLDPGGMAEPTAIYLTEPVRPS